MCVRGGQKKFVQYAQNYNIIFVHCTIDKLIKMCDNIGTVRTAETLNRNSVDRISTVEKRYYYEHNGNHNHRKGKHTIQVIQEQDGGNARYHNIRP